MTCVNVHQKVDHVTWDLQTLNRFKAFGFDGVHVDRPLGIFDFHPRHGKFRGYQIILDDDNKWNVPIEGNFARRGEQSDSCLERFDILYERLFTHASKLGIAFVKQILDLAVKLVSQPCFSFFFRNGAVSHSDHSFRY